VTWTLLASTGGKALCSGAILTSLVLGPLTFSGGLFASFSPAAVHAAEPAPSTAPPQASPDPPIPETVPPPAPPSQAVPAAQAPAVGQTSTVEGPEKYLSPSPESRPAETPVPMPEPAPPPTEPTQAQPKPDAPQGQPKPESAQAQAPPVKTAQPATPPAAEKRMRIKVSTGNLREQASLQSKINAQLKKGEAVTVLERKGDWFQVELADGETGWVHASILAQNGSGESWPTASGGDSASSKGRAAGTTEKIVRVSVGNIRKHPALDGEILLKVKKGDFLHVLEKRNEWYPVALPDQTRGYAHQILFEPEPLAAPPPAGKTASRGYELKGIRIEASSDQEEKVHFFFDGDQSPRTFFTTAGHPRIVCDFFNTRPGDAITPETKVGDALIQSVRIGRKKDAKPLTRVVFDLTPGHVYRLQHFFEKGLGYTLIIKKTHN